MSLLDEKARLSSPSRSSSSIGFLSPSAVSTSHRTPSPPADRQNAICKAMGALFLQHRVQCLEEDVAKLDRKNFHLGGKHKGRDGRGGGPHMGREPGKKSGCPFQRRAEKYKTVATSEEMPQSRAELLVVVDASVLIYSLRSVHEWLKEGKTRVVIPDEACRTLDVLKTKEDRLGLAARKAARFIEERMVQGRQADVTHSPAPQSVQTPSRRSSWYRCPSATSSGLACRQSKRRQ
ncbi:hypothetical protein BCV69DRAFT_45578 [Microstroma glucosiphilum]|uniref:PIN domain-containing protein n=1 Tax=Pseudomicrostroma glucosiphilum TaxID=1684307 RepID=A0A316U179_9BASI|nr:hypothetical protein BCV69DRAFT_45578 [Pseudomicrostroma glucosiphilum]PWN19142.1 hypothetical protein BCV69DRAFT_45578 [Pseudomicrostroma glucosiphilum]